MDRQIRRVLTLLLLTATTISADGQSEPKFKTAGEAEEHWAKKIFENDYKKEYHERFKGKIVKLDSMTYKFDTVELKVWDIPKDFELIFDIGLLWPTRYDKAISHIEELTELNPNPTIRRFRCLLYPKRVVNPTVVLFELTNNNATNRTKTKRYIKGSTMTFYKWGWAMI